MTDTYFRLSTRPGWIEVITGCMFSGKSEELIRQIRRAELARQKVKVFKPKIDDRYSKNEVASHNNNKSPSIVIENPLEILHHVDIYTQVVGIDEVQFFPEEILGVIHQLAEEGKRVIVAGLDTDWRGAPFGPMPKLLAQAEVINKQYAICMVCGEPATRTQRLVSDQQNILVGSTEAYEARCRRHFDPELSLRLEKASHKFSNQEENPDLGLQL
ncbi:MAG: thymidine kinase [Bdellovibrionaceae bacterium]|nr:thymidine kinase [Pseudobdellovibrionaceae bacterium]